MKSNKKWIVIGIVVIVIGLVVGGLLSIHPPNQADMAKKVGLPCGSEGCGQGLTCDSTTNTCIIPAHNVPEGGACVGGRGDCACLPTGCLTCTDGKCTK